MPKPTYSHSAKLEIREILRIIAENPSTLPTPNDSTYPKVITTLQSLINPNDKESTDDLHEEIVNLAEQIKNFPQKHLHNTMVGLIKQLGKDDAVCKVTVQEIQNLVNDHASLTKMALDTLIKLAKYMNEHYIINVFTTNAYPQDEDVIDTFNIFAKLYKNLYEINSSSKLTENQKLEASILLLNGCFQHQNTLFYLEFKTFLTFWNDEILKEHTKNVQCSSINSFSITREWQPQMTSTLENRQGPQVMRKA